jgi:putative SOS response-associated peptidase YedK
MCGRYTLSNPSPLQLRFKLTEFADVRLPPMLPRYNIAPSQSVPVVVETPRGRGLRQAVWGFRPAWAAASGPTPINARAETVASNGLFRGALRRRRCLVVADGFYEWRALPGESRRQPYYLRLRGGGLFAVAGICSGDAGSGEEPDTVALLTTAPNELVAVLHGRMPAILAPDDEARWLDPELTDPAGLLPLLRPYPTAAMEAYPVGRLVSWTGNDGAELVRPLGLATGDRSEGRPLLSALTRQAG